MYGSSSQLGVLRLTRIVNRKIYRFSAMCRPYDKGDKALKAQQEKEKSASNIAPFNKDTSLS